MSLARSMLGDAAAMESCDNRGTPVQLVFYVGSCKLSAEGRSAVV